MDAKELINYKKLSLLLTGNDNSIRKGKCPKIYKDIVLEIETIVQYFINKTKNK